VPAWDPPSAPRGLRYAAEPCPHCSRAEVLIELRGTRWVCEGCQKLVTPPGVLAPYLRGPGAARTARSQRERDDDAKRTAMLAGEFLRRVAALLADPKVHPQSADVLTWYQEEVTDARRSRDAARLAELAGQFEDDRTAGAFRRLHWWQGQPAALAEGHPDDEDCVDDGQGDNWEDDGQGHEPKTTVAASPAALTAAPQRATWAEAFAAYGWHLATWDGSETCQVAGPGGRCGEPTGGHPPVSDGLAADGWVCAGHYEALNAACRAISRQRGFT
jgi:hypothetical protein